MNKQTKIEFTGAFGDFMDGYIRTIRANGMIARANEVERIAQRSANDVLMHRENVELLLAEIECKNDEIRRWKAQAEYTSEQFELEKKRRKDAQDKCEELEGKLWTWVAVDFVLVAIYIAAHLVHWL